LAKGVGVSCGPLGQVQVMLASHVILHDAVVLEAHGADGALRRSGGAMLLAHMALQAPRVIVPPAHPTLHLTLSRPCNTNTRENIIVGKKLINKKFTSSSVPTRVWDPDSGWIGVFTIPESGSAF